MDFLFLDTNGPQPSTSTSGITKQSNTSNNTHIPKIDNNNNSDTDSD